MILSIILSGFSISLSLIAAIGAQNAFVLKQGLKREHILSIIILYIISDIFLFTIGIYGFGSLIKSFPNLVTVIKWAGIIFLAGYGAKSLYSAITITQSLNPYNHKKTSFKKTILIFLALTWLNPHVYLDTVVLIGTISASFSPHELLFWSGSILASIFWAVTLGYGARLLQPIFAKPITWRILDTTIAFIMWGIALQIYLSH